MVSVTERLSKIVPRCREFYYATEPGHLLLQVTLPVEPPPIPPLYSFDLDRQLGEWLDYKLAAARAVWQSTDGLDDDSLPSICPHFGIGEHSAWLGMEMRLQESTCLPTPIVRELSDVDRLTLREETPWFGYMKRGYDHLRSRKDGTFLLSVRGAFGPMDLANALRGDDLFTDFALDPQGVHRLMEFCTRALVWWYPRLLSWADEVDGGHIFMYTNSWMGPRGLGHITNDAAMLCRPAIYDEFAFPYERIFCEGYNFVLYHVHNQKLHFAPRAAHLPHMALLEVTNDPNTPEALEDLPRVLAATGAANLMLRGTSDQVRAHLDEIKERNAFLVVSCTDRADARDVIAFVRAKGRKA
jgi:hypothetical protein